VCDRFGGNLQKRKYTPDTRVLGSGNSRLDVDSPRFGHWGDTGNTGVKPRTDRTIWQGGIQNADEEIVNEVGLVSLQQCSCSYIREEGIVLFCFSCLFDLMFTGPLPLRPKTSKSGPKYIMSVKYSLYFLMTCYWLIPVESSCREVSLPFRNDNGGQLVNLRASPFHHSIYQFYPHLECSGIVLCILPVLPLQVCIIL